MSKRKGTRNEHRSIRYMEDRGFRCTRAGGSLGVWDVVAFSGEVTVVIQVKTNRLPSRAERETMRGFPVSALVQKEIHIWYDRNPIPVVLAA